MSLLLVMVAAVEPEVAAEIGHTSAADSLEAADLNDAASDGGEHPVMQTPCRSCSACCLMPKLGRCAMLLTDSGVITVPQAMMTAVGLTTTMVRSAALAPPQLATPAVIAGWAVQVGTLCCPLLIRGI